MFPYQKIGFFKHLADLQSGQSSSTEFNILQNRYSSSTQKDDRPLWKQVPRSSNRISSNQLPLLKHKDFDNLSQIKRKQVYFSDEGMKQSQQISGKRGVRKQIKRYEEVLNENKGYGSGSQMQVMEVLQKIQFEDSVVENNKAAMKGFLNLSPMPIKHDEQGSFFIGRKAQVSVEYSEPNEQIQKQQVVRQLQNRQEHHGTRSQPIQALNRSFQHQPKDQVQYNPSYQNKDNQKQVFPRFSLPDKFPEQLDGYDEQMYNKFQQYHVSPYFNEAYYDENTHFDEDLQQDNNQNSPQTYYYKSQPNMVPNYDQQNMSVSKADQSLVPSFPTFDVFTQKHQQKGLAQEQKNKKLALELQNKNIAQRKDDTQGEIEKFRNRIDSEKLMGQNSQEDMQVQLHKMGYELQFIDRSFFSDHSDDQQVLQEDENQMQKVISLMEINGKNEINNKQQNKGSKQNLDVPSLAMHSNTGSNRQISPSQLQCPTKINQPSNIDKASQQQPQNTNIVINPHTFTNDPPSDIQMANQVQKSDSIQTIYIYPCIQKRTSRVKPTKITVERPQMPSVQSIRGNDQISALDWLSTQQKDKGNGDNEHNDRIDDVPLIVIRVRNLQIVSQVNMAIQPFKQTTYQNNESRQPVILYDQSHENTSRQQEKMYHQQQPSKNYSPQLNLTKPQLNSTKPQQQQPFNSRLKQLQQTYILKLYQQTEHFQSLTQQMKQQILLLQKQRQKLSDQLYELHKQLADIKSIQLTKKQQINQVQQQNERLHNQLSELQEKLFIKQQQTQTFMIKYGPLIDDYEESKRRQYQQHIEQQRVQQQQAIRKKQQQAQTLKAQQLITQQAQAKKQSQWTQKQLTKIQHSTQSLSQEITLLYDKIQSQQQLIQQSQLQKNQLYLQLRKQKDKIKQLQLSSQLDWQQYTLKQKALQNQLKILKYHVNLLLNQNNHYPSHNIQEPVLNTNPKDQEKLQQLIKQNLLKRQIMQTHPHLLTQKIQKYRHNSYLNPQQQTKLITPLKKKNQQALLLSPKVQRIRHKYTTIDRKANKESPISHNYRQKFISKYDRHLNNIDSHQRSIKLLNQIKKDIHLLQGENKAQKQHIRHYDHSNASPKTQRIIREYGSVSPPSTVSKAIIAKNIAMDTMNSKLEKLRAQVRKEIIAQKQK